MIFRASDFQIYNGITGVTTFDISGTTVRLGGTLVVNTTGGKVYIGTGSYGNTNTSWYVDSTGLFSLKDKLTWDGTTLTITGSLTATTGAIGGWTIGATTISANNAVLDSAGQLVLGTSNDVIILSATNATYRAWVGNATAASASFSVTKAGLLFANDATIAGTFVASDDAAYPTWQGGTLSTRGVFNQRSGGTAPAYAALGFSTSSLFEANVAAGSYAAKTAVTTTDVGLLLNTKYYNGASWVGGPAMEFRNDASVSGTAAASGYAQIITTNTSGTSSIWKWQSTGALVIGSSIFTLDTNLYRSAADTLKTDDSFIAVGSITAASFSGAGTALTALNGSNIGSGTVPASFLGSGSSITTKYLRGDNTWQTISGGGDLLAANNLSDVASVATSRTNLGVTATGADTTYAFRANNLSDLASVATARTNLGVTATASDTTYAFRGNNLSDLSSASTARTNLGLGTMAVQNSSSVSITGGTIAGFTIGSSDFTANSGGTKVTFSSSSFSPKLEIGDFSGANSSTQINSGQMLVQNASGTTTITIQGSTGLLTATSFSGAGTSLTALNASNLSSGTVPDARFPATLPAASGVNLTALNATNISSGTLANARLPSAISVTSLQTANFEASITTAVDVKDANFRVYSGGTQNARIDYTTGYYYVQGNAVVGARGTKGAAGLTEIVALLDAWGAWA